MNVVFDRTEDAGGGIKTFWFKPEQPADYIAGQFTELYLPHPNADERGQRRWFTLSSSPANADVAITTRFTAGRSSSFKQTLAALQPGTPLKLADPMGDFVLPKDPSIPLIFIAAGLGITPVHSMIKYLTDIGEKRSIQLIYAVARPEELVFRDLFERYGLRFIPLIKEPPAGWRGEAGSLDVERILELIGPDDGRSRVYLSGPEPMVENFYKGLLRRGIANHRLVADYFPGYAQF